MTDTTRSMMVDAHVHLLPARLLQAIRRFFEQQGPVPFAYGADPSEVIQGHAAAGFDTLWTLPYAHRAGMARGLNADVASLAAAWSTPGLTVVPGCTVHPDDPAPADDLVRAVDAGARVLKLHCSVGGYAPDDARLTPVLRTAGDLRVPVVIHAGHAPTGRTRALELAAIDRVAAHHPETVLVIAHTAHPDTAAAIELLRRHPHLFADLTPVLDQLVSLDPDTLHAHAGQLLLGTDAPNTMLSAEAVLEWLDRQSLDESARLAIVGGNARSLVDDRR